MSSGFRPAVSTKDARHDRTARTRENPATMPLPLGARFPKTILRRPVSLSRETSNPRAGSLAVMTRLLLVRHAPVATTGKVLYGRQGGHHLTEEARTATRQLARRLSDVDLQAVYCSPLERTVETAALLAEPHRLSPVAEQGLLEVDYGEWTGQELARLYKLPEWKTVLHQPSRMRFPGGESLAEAQLRAVAACEELAGRHPDGAIALVTHADVIRLSLGFHLGQPLDLLSRLTVAPTSVSVLDISKKGAVTVAAINTNGDPKTWQ